MVAGYGDFLAGKMDMGADSGFDPVFVPARMFPFQAALLDWAVRNCAAARVDLDQPDLFDTAKGKEA